MGHGAIGDMDRDDCVDKFHGSVDEVQSPGYHSLIWPCDWEAGF